MGGMGKDSGKKTSGGGRTSEQVQSIMEEANVAVKLNYIETETAKKEVERVAGRAAKVVEHERAKDNDSYVYRLNVNLWKDYGKSRTYVSVDETSPNSKHAKTQDYGYVDNLTGEYHAGKRDADGTLYNFRGAAIE